LINTAGRDECLSVDRDTRRYLHAMLEPPSAMTGKRSRALYRFIAAGTQMKFIFFTPPGEVTATV